MFYLIVPIVQIEPVFAIQFLEYQFKNSIDNEYRVLLQIAIAYLYLYISPRKAKKLMGKVHYESSNAKSVKAIEDIKELIYTTSKRRDIVPKKKNRLNEN